MRDNEDKGVTDGATKRAAKDSAIEDTTQTWTVEELAHGGPTLCRDRGDASQNLP